MQRLQFRPETKGESVPSGRMLMDAVRQQHALAGIVVIGFALPLTFLLEMVYKVATSNFGNLRSENHP